MENEKTVFEISLLIKKYLIGEADPDELRRLEEWKEEARGHADLFDRICSQSRMRERMEQYRECGTDEALAAFMVEKKKWDEAGRRKTGKVWQMLLMGMGVAAVVVLGVTFLPCGRTTPKKEIGCWPSGKMGKIRWQGSWPGRDKFSVWTR